MSRDYDKYDLDKEVYLGTVERIIYISDIEKAKSVRDALLGGGDLYETEEFLRVQYTVLTQMAILLNQMKTFSSDVKDGTYTSTEMEEKNNEYMVLFDQFDNYRKSRYKGQKIFNDSFSENKQTFLNSLSRGWIKAAELLVKIAYGWTVNADDSWDLIINETDTGGYSAFVKSAIYSDGTADTIEMQFDLPDFSPPHTQPTSVADRVVAHEIVHVLQSQNSYFADIVGDSSRATWFKEGLAEFVHGADARTWNALQAAGVSESNVTYSDASGILDAIGTGNEAWISTEQYVAGYLAVKFLHELIIDSGYSDGIRHMTVWMKEQFDSNQGAANSGINKYFETFTINDNSSTPVRINSNDNFIQIFKNQNNGFWWLAQKILSNRVFTNTDTGSILGSEHFGSIDLNQYDVVPDASGPPESTYIQEVSEDNTPIAILPDGTPVPLLVLNSIIFGDPDYYNLKSKEAAAITDARIISLADSITASKNIVAINLATIQPHLGSPSGLDAYINNIIGARQNKTQFENAVVLEKRHFLDDNITLANHQYSHQNIPAGSELWLDGEKIWPFYREVRKRVGSFCYPWWQGIESFGYSVALADETINNTIAVGSPYDSNGSAGAYTFSMLDKSLNPVGYGGFQGSGFSPGDYFGESVDVNYDGTVMAVGATQHSRSYCKRQSGYVIVKQLVDQEVEVVQRSSGLFERDRRYTKIEKKWIDKGGVIGGDPYDRVGYKVKLSKDGNTLAISNVHNSQSVCHVDSLGQRTPRNFHKGSVRVYTYDAPTDEWLQKGSTMWGVEDYEGFGIGLDMTPDGNCIVVGSPYYFCPFNLKVGRAQVFKFSGGDWKRVGESITPANFVRKATYEQEMYAFKQEYTYTTGNSAGGVSPSTASANKNGRFGYSVSISGNGRLVAIGAPGASGGALAISVYEWDRYYVTGNDWDRNKWSGHSKIGSTGSGSGFNVCLNDAGNILAYSTPAASNPVSPSNLAPNTGKVTVCSYDGVNNWVGAGVLKHESYGPGAGSYLGRIDLSPSGRYIAMGSPIAPDRSNSGWDYMIRNSSTSFGSARVCDLTNLVKNLDLPTGQASIAFSSLSTLNDALAADRQLCPATAEDDQADEEDEPSEEVTSPQKDPDGSPPKDVGEPPVIRVKEEDPVTGEVKEVDKQVYVAEEDDGTKTVVYITEWIDPTNCQCEVDSGKKNNTKTQQVYTPPDDGIMIEKNGTVTQITKNTNVTVPPGATTFTRRPPLKKVNRPKKKRNKPNRWDCPFKENWVPQALGGMDCKFYDPDYEHPNKWPENILGKKTDGGRTNSSVTTVTRTATKRGYVTKEQNPPDGTVKPEFFEPGDEITIAPGETVYQEGGGNDDAGYGGGTYTTETGAKASPSNVLKEHDSGSVNNTVETVVIQRERSCEEYCKCLKVKKDGTVEEFDIREDDVNLEPGDTLFRGEEKETNQSDPSQSDAGYEGGSYTNDSGKTFNPETVVDDDTGAPFLSSPGPGTKNTSTSDAEYIPSNNVIVHKKNGTVVKVEVDEGSGTPSITLEPGDTIFEDDRPPQDKGSFKTSITGPTITRTGGGGNVDINIDNLIGGSSNKTLITNHGGDDTDIQIPPGHTGLIVGPDGEAGIIEGGSGGTNIKLKPGESITYGKNLSGVGGGGYTEGDGTGGIQNEEDVGFFPLDKILSGGNQGIKNRGDENLNITVPAGKKATVIGPNNEIKIITGPVDYGLPPGNTINIGEGDSGGFNSAGYTTGKKINGVKVSDLIDDPDEGVTNDTSEPICVPVVTKEIETDDGTQTLLEKDNSSGKLLLKQSKNIMMSLMKNFGITPRFTNSVGIFRAKNPYTTISRDPEPDDCEPGYEKLQPGETMFRGKSNGIEDAEYTSGSFTDPNTGISNGTDISSIINNPTSGLTNDSGEDKDINLPADYSGVIIDFSGGISLANGSNGGTVTLKAGDSLVIGETAGVSDAGYGGSGNVSGNGTDLSSFMINPSSGIKNTSNSDKSIELKSGSSGLLLNPTTKEVIFVDGQNAVIPNGFNLYEGTGLKISSAEIVPTTPFEGYTMSSIFDDNAQINDGITNTSSENITLVVPSGKAAFHLTPGLGSGNYNFPEAGSTITLEPGDTLVTGNDFEEYTITLDSVDNGVMTLSSPSHDQFKTVPGTTLSTTYAISSGESITLKGNEYFSVRMHVTSSAHQLDFIKVNGSVIQPGITQDFVSSSLASNITITGAVKIKTIYSVTVVQKTFVTLHYRWSGIKRLSNGDFIEKTSELEVTPSYALYFTEGTTIEYYMQSNTGADAWEFKKIEIGSSEGTAETGSFTVGENLVASDSKINYDAQISEGNIELNPVYQSNLVTLQYRVTDTNTDGNARFEHDAYTRWAETSFSDFAEGLATAEGSNPQDAGAMSNEYEFKSGTTITVNFDHILAFNRTIDKILINGEEYQFTIGENFDLVLDSDKVIDITYKNIKSPQSYLDITFLSGVKYKLLTETESQQLTISNLNDASFPGTFTSGSLLSPIDTSDYKSVLIMSSAGTTSGGNVNMSSFNSEHDDVDNPWNNFRMYTEYPGGTASNIFNKNQMLTDHKYLRSSTDSGGNATNGVWYRVTIFTYMYIEIPLSLFTDAGYDLNTPIYIQRLLDD